MKYSAILSAILIVVLTFSCEVVAIIGGFEPIETNYDVGGRAWMTIDSIEYRTCRDFPYPPNVRVIASSNAMYLSFIFNCDEDNQPSRCVILDLQDFEGVKEYELNKTAKDKNTASIAYNYKQYTTDEVYNGLVTITDYSEVENTVSGTYEFQAINDSLGVINLSNGVFTRIAID